MKFKILLAASLLCSQMALSETVAVATDLSSWVAEGTGKWVIASDKNSVTQTRNKRATVFHNNTDSQGKKLSGSIKVNTSHDDDFIGFVLGYQSQELENSNADYILIDWKQKNQNYQGSYAKRGLSISRVTTDLEPSPNNAWTHTEGVEELQRATTLGDTGWADKTEYSFDITFTQALIEVYVDGNKELSITGSFNNGAYGFYNYSQASVIYSNLEEQELPPVPVPAAVWLFGSALAGLAARKVKQ